MKQLLPEEKLLGAIFGERMGEGGKRVKLEGLRQAIDAALDTLPKEEQKRVIHLRFGFDDGESKTLQEVGEIFGVTRERIRAVEAIALRRLRHPSCSRKLKGYFYEDGLE